MTYSCLKKPYPNPMNLTKYREFLRLTINGFSIDLTIHREFSRLTINGLTIDLTKHRVFNNLQ